MAQQTENTPTITKFAETVFTDGQHNLILTELSKRTSISTATQKQFHCHCVTGHKQSVFKFSQTQRLDTLG